MLRRCEAGVAEIGRHRQRECVTTSCREVPKALCEIHAASSTKRLDGLVEIGEVRRCATGRLGEAADSDDEHVHLT